MSRTSANDDQRKLELRPVSLHAAGKRVPSNLLQACPSLLKLRKTYWSGVALKVGNHCWIGSVQGAIATWSVFGMQLAKNFGLLWLDQVAIAPCTDPIQVRL